MGELAVSLAGRCHIVFQAFVVANVAVAALAAIGKHTLGQMIVKGGLALGKAVVELLYSFFHMELTQNQLDLIRGNALCSQSQVLADAIKVCRIFGILTGDIAEIRDGTGDIIQALAGIGQSGPQQISGPFGDGQAGKMGEIAAHTVD